MGEDRRPSRNPDVNHCLLEVEVLEAPKIRYTQDNQTPIAEMNVRLEGLRPEDPAGELKVVGFGSLAQDLQNRGQVGQRLVVEGRLRMNTVARQDGAGSDPFGDGSILRRSNKTNLLNSYRNIFNIIYTHITITRTHIEGHTQTTRGTWKARNKK